MKVLELFSGTHSIGKVAHSLGWEVVSLDRDLKGSCPFGSGYESDMHIQEDIMTWDYKKDFNKGDFDIITASPVCLWWSKLRDVWTGIRNRKIKGMDRFLTKEDIENDIEKFGKPMVDKVFEIIDYFKPKYWWIENPATGKMKNYIIDKPFYIIDYCKYSNWGYQKRTIFWTNIEGFKPLLCKKDCENIITIPTQEGAMHVGYKKLIKASTRTLHKNPIGQSNKAKPKKKSEMHKVSLGSWGKKGTSQTGVGSGNNRLERYRIPEKLIEDLFLCII